MISFIRTCVAMATLVLRTRRFRRKLMSGLTLTLLFVLGIGLWLVDGESHPLFFVLYWLGCAGGVLFLFLLAFYDTFRVRADMLEEARRLEEKLKEDLPDD